MKRMVLVLTAVTVFAGLILALADTAFAPRIEANRRASFEASLAAIYPQAKSPEYEPLELPASTVYAVSGEDGTLLGYAVVVEAAGYAGTINMLVGLTRDLGSLSGLSVVENVETPGLGARISEPWFREQFEGLDPESRITYVKNRKPETEENQIEAISGATISTSAVVSGINGTLAAAAEEIRRVNGGQETAE